MTTDRPFTYLLPAEFEAGTGSLVSVPFHGRLVRGWILGASHDGLGRRLLKVARVRSTVRFFDERMLELLRWVSERHIAPLSTVIERSHPPRVASEEASPLVTPDAPMALSSTTGEPPHRTPPENVFDRYEGARGMFQAGATTWVRPLPRDEAPLCLEAVAECVSRGRQALVLVPEADPLPATAGAVLEAFSGGAAAFLGGDARERYRRWLEIQAGSFEVVVGTRPAVFSPLPSLGLIWVSREVHPGHREDRSPYYHVREVAMARARIEGAGCVLAALAPSVDTAVAVSTGSIGTIRASRSLERREAPLVETTPSEGEDRSARLARVLKSVRSAALIVSRRGYGVARVCRACGEPAACSSCRGPIVVARGAARCAVCRAAGRCANCGAAAFGIERGGAERVAEWAAQAARVPVDLHQERGGKRPSAGRVFVGTAASVKDIGALSLDVVAILDPDRALARPGLRSGEQALATWMEAAAWAVPRPRGGRVLVQTRRAGHPAIQALVRWEPLGFLLDEARRRADGGFPPNHPVFRLEGRRGLDAALQRTGFASVLSTVEEGRTISLLAVAPGALPLFRREVVRLLHSGTATRVEGEPHL